MVTVTDPVKVEAESRLSKSYVKYRVNVTARVAHLASTSSVDRRFSDFYWFRNQLVANYKGIIIPPLPDKALLSMRAHMSAHACLHMPHGYAWEC
jgi:sorting nexin-1/2